MGISYSGEDGGGCGGGCEEEGGGVSVVQWVSELAQSGVSYACGEFKSTSCWFCLGPYVVGSFRNFGIAMDIFQELAVILPP